MKKAMKQDWTLVVDSYEGIKKNAVNMLSGYVAGLFSKQLSVKYVGEIVEQELNDCNVIAVGECKGNAIIAAYEKEGLISVPNEKEGYSIYVGKALHAEESQAVIIAGADDNGVLYGCMQFINEYCGDRLYRINYYSLCEKECFVNPFERELATWQITASPTIKTRAIWTWGHVIYDYKSFFENMARLRLNEAVIWNDCVPFNARDVVDYAHGLGIKVVWGFAWGWTTYLKEKMDELCGEEGLKKVKREVLETYETQYAKTGADGIYFQSFTEVDMDNVNGKCIAEIVTELVNEIAGELWKKHPNLHIQFGLHATSVKTHLDVLRKVDERLHIVWEDCGAFPYNYCADKIEDFEETYALTEKLLSLRGTEERFGAVLKGMLALDWSIFEHYTGSNIIGERPKTFIRERQVYKDKIWKIVRTGWLKNAEYARKLIALIKTQGNAPIVEALVEDALLENKIALPVAIYAQMLWSPSVSIEEIIEKASQNPFVENA